MLAPMNLRLLLLTTLVLPLAACGEGAAVTDAAAAEAPAATSAAPAAKAAAPVPAGDARIALAAKIPGAKAEDLRPTPVPGVFELVHDSDISYVTEDARYVFSGDLYQITGKGDFPNLSEVRRRELRLAALAAMPESNMLVYGPADAKHTVTVFTDIDCPWCRRLHSQMKDYNKLGIRVRYLLFPRTGPDTESWAKADSVWCAADRKDAFTHATNGEDVAHRDCPASPVARSYQLGRDVGVSGTPGVVLETGELIPGYLPPAQMLAQIEAGAAAAAQSN
jgi:thiol:disulfide interchange protein DsbC